MDRDLAKHVVTVGFHSLSLLEGLIPLLKEHCTEVEYDDYLKSIASVSGNMMTDIFQKIFSQYPDLEVEVENKIKNMGNLFDAPVVD